MPTNKNTNLAALATFFSPTKIAFLATTILATTIAFIIIGNKGIFQLLSEASVKNISILILLLLGRWGFMLLRTQLLLKAQGFKPRYRDTMATLWALDFAAESTPGGVGGPIVCMTFFKFFKVPISTTAAMIIIAFSLDILAIASLLTMALASTTLSEKIDLSALLIIAISVMGSALFCMLALIKYHRHLLRRAGKSTLLKKLPYYEKTRPMVKFFLRTGNAFRRWKNITVFQASLLLVSSFGFWACRLSIIYFVIQTLSHHVSWANALLAQFAGGLMAMLVIVPGGFIGAELSAGALLLPFLDIKIVAGVTLLWRLLTYHTNFIVGGLSFLWITTRMKKA